MEKSCPFCTRSQFEERLAGSVGGLHVIATLGQITDGGYLLLVSKEHALCLGALPSMKGLEWAIAHLSVALSKEYDAQNVTIFEHGIVGQTVFHAHLHLIPNAVAIGERVRKDFPHHPIQKFADFATFRSVCARRQEPYLLWKEPGGNLSACWNPPAPPQYLRIIVAEALGRPERANWRTMDAELDRKFYLETVSRIKSYAG